MAATALTLLLSLIPAVAGCVDGDEIDLGTASVLPEVVGAARENLARVAGALDERQLAAYGLSGEPDERFVRALELAYPATSAEYRARVWALAAMAFTTDGTAAGTGLLPFQGLDLRQFQNVVALHSLVLDEHARLNGSPVGLRPLSVCETRYIIDEIARPGRQYEGFASYAAGYEAFAPSCPKGDRASWYAFRGLARLGPLWGEPNVMENVEETLLARCGSPSPRSASECEQWAADRPGYREAKNEEIAARFLFHASTQQALLADVERGRIALVGDRNGDGVADFLRAGPTRLLDGSLVELAIEPSGNYAGALSVVGGDGSAVPIAPRDLLAEEDVDPSFRGGLAVLDAPGCGDAIPSAQSCPLLARIELLLRRHAVYYETYRALAPDESGLFRRASPLLACSMDPSVSQRFALGEEPQPGQIGFLTVMRIAFRDLLTCRRTSTETIRDPASTTVSIQDVHDGAASPDLTSLWLDVSCLPDNPYAFERELADLRPAAAMEIEGVVAIELTEGSPCPAHWRGDGACDLCLSDDPDCDPVDERR